MGAVMSELVTYLIKFVVMIACAVGGVAVGKVIRKRKNEKMAEENQNQ